jgi:regulator of replication initiation timing
MITKKKLIGLLLLCVLGVVTPVYTQQQESTDSVSLVWQNGKLVSHPALPQARRQVLHGLDNTGIPKDLPTSKDEAVTQGKIYSQRKIKSIFDSLGLTKMDTLLALASLKPEVGEEDMIKMINESVAPGGKQLSDVNKLAALSNSKLSPESLSELAPLSGMQLEPDKLKDPRYLLRKISSGMDSLHLGKSEEAVNRWHASYNNKRDSLLRSRDQVNDLLSVGKEVNFSGRQLDSLNALRSDFNKTLDSLEQVKTKAESLANQYKKYRAEAERMKKDPKNAIPEYVESQSKNFKAKEKETTDEIKEVVVSHKQGILSPVYFEGLLSTFRDVQGKQEFHLAPGFGYEIAGGFSLGASPNILIRPEENQWKILAGYRGFAKYRVFKQRGYLQVEDAVNPSVLTDEMKHSILAGGGGLIPLSEKIAINAALLYRVYGDDPTGNNWVFRIGLSSKSSKGAKK